MGVVEVICLAGHARETMRQFPGSMAWSARRPNFLFRLAKDGEGFECRDEKTGEDWRRVGPGNLLYVEGEQFILALAG